MRYLIGVIYLVCLVLAVSAIAGGTRLITTDEITHRVRSWWTGRFGEQTVAGSGIYCNRCVPHYVSALFVLPLSGCSVWLYQQQHLWVSLIPASPVLVLSLSYLAFRLLDTE